MNRCKFCNQETEGRRLRCTPWKKPSVFAEEHRNYLNSDEWKITRARIMERSNGKCERCENYAEDVHHLNYCRLGYELETDLQALCHKCHTVVHQLQKAGIPVPNKSLDWTSPAKSLDVLFPAKRSGWLL